jgi:hypothetical protein
MADKPTFSIFTGFEHLGKVYTEQMQINVDISTFNVPFSGTEGAVNINWKGKKRIITIQGVTDGDGFTGVSSEAKILAFVTKIESWVAANVQASRLYFDSLGRQWTVYCVDFQWTRTVKDPNRLLWSFLLIQGAI